ncbi:hypothetical protein BpHYR1_046363 [Brachionus plicatilis]|uniref:Uncharacterized protein n=1 Tax=Brachionus plicatilis TaxID=10195 RepID=A0A3M7RGE1_BRAPC|nr:hypothetical protein BpHYR1_046363 [Brachionus plicatilis]
MIAPEYYSSQEEDDVEKTFEKTVHESQKKTRKIPIWDIIQTFDSADDAEKSIGKEWLKFNNNMKAQKSLIDAIKRGKQCSAKMCLLHHCHNQKVTLFKNEAEHDHNNSPVKQGIDENAKVIINELLSDGIEKANTIINILEKKMLRKLDKLSKQSEREEKKQGSLLTGLIKSSLYW